MNEPIYLLRTALEKLKKVNLHVLTRCLHCTIWSGSHPLISFYEWCQRQGKHAKAACSSNTSYTRNTFWYETSAAQFSPAHISRRHDLVYFFGHRIIDRSNEMDMDLLDHPPWGGPWFLDLVHHRSRPGS